MENKIIIATDLDETTFSYLDGLKKHLAENYNKGFDEAPTSYSLVESGWFPDFEEFRRIHGEAVDNGLYRNLIPYEKASEILWDIVGSGYENNILTARFINPGQHKTVVSDTAESLDKHSIPHSNLLFLKDKTRFEADIYIDDSPSNLLSLQHKGKTTITFDQAYNKSIPGYRAGSWDDIREILYTIFGK